MNLIDSISFDVEGIGNDFVTISEGSISSLLPKNAVKVKVYPGDFNGDGFEDFVVYFEFEETEKAILRTYLYDVKGGKFLLKREDSGVTEKAGFGWMIREVKVVDFDGNGSDEVFVLKLEHGTGGYKQNYVMKFDNGEMKDAEFVDDGVDDGRSGGRVFVNVVGNSIKYVLRTFAEGDANCCPSGKVFEDTWRYDGDKFILEKTLVLPSISQ